MWVLGGFLGAAVFLVMDSAGLNRLCDIIVPFYLAASVVILVLFIKQAKKKNSENEGVDARIYAFKKKENLANMSWKRRLVGKWDKLQRDPNAFYEVKGNRYPLVQDIFSCFIASDYCFSSWCLTEPLLSLPR